MDHEHYDWSPIVKRGKLQWPDDARVAVCVIVTLEHMEWSPPPDSHTTVLAGSFSPLPWPDVFRMSHREYGHRVGIFRILDLLEKHGIKPTIAMDALTAENYPYLLNHCMKSGAEIIGHGISVSRMITSKMSEQEEREYIQESLDSLKRATGKAPAGWLGPEYGESARTPQLLAEAGVRYVCDWTNDEQPYAMKSSKGELYALPIMLELDDVQATFDRRMRIERYAKVIKECFEGLYDDGARNGRVMVLHLHPWLMGQPFRIRHLDDALGHIMARDGVWAATGTEIIDWYRSHRPAVSLFYDYVSS